MNQIKHFLSEGARPSYGNDSGRLAAYTAAFLTLSGLAEGDEMKKDDAIRVVGPTAVSYHCKLGNFAKAGGNIKLTEQGRAFFTERGAPNNDLFAAYQKVMLTGELHELAGVSNPVFVKAF